MEGKNGRDYFSACSTVLSNQLFSLNQLELFGISYIQVKNHNMGDMFIATAEPQKNRFINILGEESLTGMDILI
jgi:hypothetical protein